MFLPNLIVKDLTRDSLRDYAGSARHPILCGRRRPAAGRRPVSVNRREHPSASVHYGRTDKFLPNLIIKDLTRDSLRDFAGTSRQPYFL